MFQAEDNEQHIVQCVTVQQTQEGTNRQYFVTKTLEDVGGRLRLARRGNTIFYLTSEGSSPNFRLWGRRECSTDPIALDGLRLLAQIHELGQTSVVWKSLIVRAERLTGPAVGQAEARAPGLNP
jgi:hypothetical protein